MLRYTDSEMLAELRRVAATIGGQLSRPRYIAAKPTISAPAITARFGGWNAALTRAGLALAARVPGGQQRECDVCGKSYRYDGGAKASKTCSRECSSELMSRQRSRGDSATLQAARGRAVRATRDRKNCERCGVQPGARPHHRHHKDRNPYNNDPANIEVLCKDCHVAEHVAAGDGWAAAKPHDAAGRFARARS